MLPMVFTSDSIAPALWTQRQLPRSGSNIGELRGRGVVQGWGLLNYLRSGGEPHALAQLTEQIDTGKVYDGDLPALAAALGDVRSALNRRPVWRRQHPS